MAHHPAAQKPFACSKCKQSFASEDRLAVHKKKHDLRLTAGSHSSAAAAFSDQTPTPTKFLNMKEESLTAIFQEIRNPFDESFKKAIATADLSQSALGGGSVHDLESTTDADDGSLVGPVEESLAPGTHGTDNKPANAGAHEPHLPSKQSSQEHQDKQAHTYYAAGKQKPVHHWVHSSQSESRAAPQHHAVMTSPALTSLAAMTRGPSSMSRTPARAMHAPPTHPSNAADLHRQALPFATATTTESRNSSQVVSLARQLGSQPGKGQGQSKLAAVAASQSKGSSKAATHLPDESHPEWDGRKEPHASSARPLNGSRQGPATAHPLSQAQTVDGEVSMRCQGDVAPAVADDTGRAVGTTDQGDRVISDPSAAATGVATLGASHTLTEGDATSKVSESLRHGERAKALPGGAALVQPSVLSGTTAHLPSTPGNHHQVKVSIASVPPAAPGPGRSQPRRVSPAPGAMILPLGQPLTRVLAQAAAAQQSSSSSSSPSGSLAGSGAVPPASLSLDVISPAPQSISATKMPFGSIVVLSGGGGAAIPLTPATVLTPTVFTPSISPAIGTKVQVPATHPHVQQLRNEMSMNVKEKLKAKVQGSQQGSISAVTPIKPAPPSTIPRQQVVRMRPVQSPLSAETRVPAANDGSNSNHVTLKRKETMLERNRAAAMRCRQKKKVFVEDLKSQNTELTAANKKLLAENAALKREMASMKALLMEHRDCPQLQALQVQQYHTKESS